MQRLTGAGHSVTSSYVTPTTYWPAAAAAGYDDDGDAVVRTSVDDFSPVDIRSAWAMSAERHSGTL